MLRKSLVIGFTVLTMFVLAACSGGNTLEPGAVGDKTANTSIDPTSGVVPGRQDDLSDNQSPEMLMAIGTLKLEGTGQAVTKEQAARLLPLWKAVKSLASSDAVAPDEISALYVQIKETMTSEQVQAIESTKLAQEEITTLMAQYGVEMPQNPMGNLSEEERATRQAQFQDGGLPKYAPEGGLPGDVPGGETAQTQGEPQPGQGGRGMRSAGMNLLFVDPLITLLEVRAGS